MCLWPRRLCQCTYQGKAHFHLHWAVLAYAAGRFPNCSCLLKLFILNHSARHSDCVCIHNRDNLASRTGHLWLQDPGDDYTWVKAFRFSSLVLPAAVLHYMWAGGLLEECGVQHRDECWLCSHSEARPCQEVPPPALCWLASGKLEPGKAWDGVFRERGRSYINTCWRWSLSSLPPFCLF